MLPKGQVRGDDQKVPRVLEHTHAVFNLLIAVVIENTGNVALNTVNVCNKFHNS